MFQSFENFGVEFQSAVDAELGKRSNFKEWEDQLMKEQEKLDLKFQSKIDVLLFLGGIP